MAAEAGAPKIVEQLLKKAKTLGITADLVNALDSQNCHALLLAAKTGEPETVKLLVEANSDLTVQETTSDNMTALQRASLHGHGKAVEAMLGCEAMTEEIINFVKPDGFNALMLGALMGQTAAVRVLLAAKADPNFQFKTEDEELKKKGSKGETALMYACKNGHSDAARALLQSGADPLLKDDAGKTALMHCSSAPSKDANAAAALLKIDETMVNLEDKEGRRRCTSACRRQAKMVVLLQKPRRRS